jgi:Na+(H+)/acetate symporter ActP
VPKTTLSTRPSATTLPRTNTTVSRSGVTAYPYYTVPATTTASSTTVTTIAGINGQVPSAPATVPLTTKASNGHVNFVFAWISVGGFAVALAMVAWRLFVTRAGGLDRAPYTE